MARNERRRRAHRHRLSETGGWYSDDFLFGVTGGFYPLLPRSSSRPGTIPQEAGQTFEETYPRYPFSELVRLSIGLAKLLARVSRNRPDRPPATPDQVGRPVERPDLPISFR